MMNQRSDGYAKRVEYLMQERRALERERLLEASNEKNRTLAALTASQAKRISVLEGKLREAEVVLPPAAKEGDEPLCSIWWCGNLAQFKDRDGLCPRCRVNVDSWRKEKPCIKQ